MENTPDRLKIFMKHLGLNQAQFAESLGVPKNQVSQYIKRSTNSLSRATIDKISAVYPELSLDWLLNGVGEMLRIAPIPEGLDLLSYGMVRHLCKDEITRLAAIKYLKEN